MIARRRMSTLGTMMLRAGLLSEGQVADASEHARIKTISYVDAILELGLADEDTLVAFLASKLMIPRVRAAILERVDERLAERMPGELAWELLAVPVSVDEYGNLTVAMADPTDNAAVERLAKQTGTYLVRAVASVANLRRALMRLYGSEQQVRERAEAARAAARARAQHEHLAAAELTLRKTDVTMPAVARSSLPLRPSQEDTAVGPAPSAPEELAQFPSDDELGGDVQHVDGDTDSSDELDPEADIPTQVDLQPAIEPAPRPRSATPPPLPGIHDDDDATPFEPEPAEPPVQEPSAPLTRTLVPTEAPPQVQEEHPPTVDDTGLVEPVRGPRRAARARAHTPWNPPLRGFNSDPVPLSPDAFAQVLPKLDQARDRDEVTTVLLDFLGAGFKRVILFVHSHNELRGHDARGEDLMVEAVRQVRIPSGGKSMFAEAIERERPLFGPMRETSKIDQAFSQALGGLKGNVLLLPIKLGPKIPLVVFAHGTTHAVDPHSIQELSNAVSTAILRILAALKRGQ